MPFMLGECSRQYFRVSRSLAYSCLPTAPWSLGPATNTILLVFPGADPAKPELPSKTSPAATETVRITRIANILSLLERPTFPISSADELVRFVVVRELHLLGVPVEHLAFSADGNIPQAAGFAQ